jgi:hypothetical protein
VNLDQLSKLQENLARDLVHFEDNKSLTEEQIDEITRTYSQVYDTVAKIKNIKHGDQTS